MRHRPFLWQTSLRTLLISAVALGALTGLVGPNVVRAVREYWQSPPPAFQLPPPPVLPPRHFRESDGYFESAETPLR